MPVKATKRSFGWLFFLVASQLVVPAYALATARNPFSVGVEQGGGDASGVFGWILYAQEYFYQLLKHQVVDATHYPAAIWGLVGLSAAYGVFHAAGPGHGKLIIASYAFAHEKTLQRGIILSILSAILQACVAIVLVSIMGILFHATQQQLDNASQIFEIICDVGLITFGVLLFWRKFRALKAKIRGREPSASGFFCEESQTADLAIPRSQFLRSQFLTKRSNINLPPQSKSYGFEPHGAYCGHVHSVNAQNLVGQFSWRSALQSVAIAGLRPCSGALLVLTFALINGIYWVGIICAGAMALGTAFATSTLAAFAATNKHAIDLLTRKTPKYRTVILQGLEVVASLAIILLGAFLLFGVVRNL